MDECMVWQQFKEGDQKALASIFSYHYSDLFRYGMRLLNNEDVVKDCIQNLFEKLWNCRQKIGHIQSVKPYLLKALRHHIFNEKNYIQQRTHFHTNYCKEYNFTSSYEDMLIAEQMATDMRLRLLKSMNLLSKRQREAIYLRTFEELEYKKISEMMSLNTQSIRNLISQGMKTLKQHREYLNY
jgi:RNA polymerase sigma factor (sigma-70 family)